MEGGRDFLGWKKLRKCLKEMQESLAGLEFHLDKTSLTDFFSLPLFLFFKQFHIFIYNPTFSRNSRLSLLLLCFLPSFPPKQAHHISLIILYLHSITMADELSFQELVQPDWLNEVSRMTDKHMQTHSEVSREHFFDNLLEEELDNQGLLPEKTQNQQRERNKYNAKNYRDRKRMHSEIMKKQIEHLSRENELLRNQKYCRWCKRSFAPNVLIATETAEKKESGIQNVCSHQKKDMEMEFQKPELFSSLRKPKNPKIWIALGVLMLVLGLTMHGLNGDKTYISKIELQKQQINKWVTLIKEQDKGDYFDVSMRVKEEKVSSKQEGVSLAFRAPAERSLEQKEEKISINRELLYGIHAELDDIGVYL